MTKTRRIVTEIVLPPAIGALIVIGGFVVHEPLQPKAVGFIVLFAYIYALVPSIAFAALMEVAYSRGLSPLSWRWVALSSALGLVAGLIIGFVFPEPSFIQNVLPMLAIGVAAGAVTGLIVKVASRPAIKNA